MTEFVVRERSRLLAFVRRQWSGLSLTDAEDVLADVTYNLLSRADVVTQAENLAGYVYRSLANRIVDRRRRTVTTVPLDTDSSSVSDEVTGSMRNELHDTSLSPDRAAELSELQARLHAALGALTKRERAIWLATEIDGRSFRDLATDWGEPIGTLLSLKSRATARLRTLLSDYRGTVSPEE